MSTSPVLSDPVTLKSPLQRGEQKITSVQVRTPRAGELRGVKLSELLATDVDSLRAVLPRVTVPTIAAAELDTMDPGDFVQLGAKVVDFLLPAESQAPVSQSA
jgi:hypothetical protein